LPRRRILPNRCNLVGVALQCLDSFLSRRDAPRLSAAEVPAMARISPMSGKRFLLLITGVAVLLVSGILVVGATSNAQERPKQGPRMFLPVERDRPRILQPPAKPEPEDDFATYQRTQQWLIKSRLVLNAALRDPRVSDLKIIQEKLAP